MKLAKLIMYGLFLIGHNIFAPLVTIWALNTLFGLGIPTTFVTWVAIFWLGSIIHNSKTEQLRLETEKTIKEL